MPDEDGPYRELPPYLQGNHIPRRGVDTFLDGSFGGAHGGHGGISHDDLQHDGFSPSMGQVTTPPMWKDASRSPRTVQLRVCHVRDGIDYHVGAIHARASVRELARKFRRPGVYRLTPVDMTGNSTGSTFPIAIAEDHEVLREEAASANGQGGGVPVGHGTGLGQLDPAVLAFFSQQVETARSEAERERRALQQERQQLQTEHRQISKERMSLAVTNTSAAVDLHTKLIDKDQERNSSAQDRLLMFMQAQQDLQAQRSEAMMLQLQQQSALVQKQMETSVQSEQLRLDAERTRIQEERKREREDQRRREDESKRANEREAERQREHTRLVVSLLEKQNTPVDPMATVTGMLEKAEPLMDMAKKYLPMLQLGGAAGGGITETIASTIGQVVQGQVEVAKAQAEAMAQTAALHQQQIAEIPPEEYEAMMMAQQQAQAGAAHPGQQLQPHQAAPFQAPSQSVMDRPGGSPMGGPTPDASAAFAPSFYPQGEEPPPFQSYDPTPAPSPYRAAPPDSAAEMAPAQAKAARRAVRILVQQLRTLPQGDWIEAVTGAITHDPVVVPFLRLVGIRGAIMECGGDMNLADAVIHTLDAVGDLVPADIPR
tara:strand:- start:936 stop:2735 length:1800 start_codon:yes stop_codon:yes gene_type:complete